MDPSLCLGAGEEEAEATGTPVWRWGGTWEVSAGLGVGLGRRDRAGSPLRAPRLGHLACAFTPLCFTPAARLGRGSQAGNSRCPWLCGAGQGPPAHLRRGRICAGHSGTVCRTLVRHVSPRCSRPRGRLGNLCRGAEGPGPQHRLLHGAGSLSLSGAQRGACGVWGLSGEAAGLGPPETTGEAEQTCRAQGSAVRVQSAGLHGDPTKLPSGHAGKGGCS